MRWHINPINLRVVSSRELRDVRSRLYTQYLRRHMYVRKVSTHIMLHKYVVRQRKSMCGIDVNELLLPLLEKLA